MATAEPNMITTEASRPGKPSKGDVVWVVLIEYLESPSELHGIYVSALDARCAAEREHGDVYRHVIQ